MKKNSKKNQKGSVLFTVICFTTVLMILTTTALSVSSYANKVSTTNVKSTQAQITAQNCLDTYLKTFLDGEGVYNFSSISTMARGKTEADPYEFDVNISGGSANVGDCKIKMYEAASSGYIIKCEATYGGKTESASAFFDGKVVKSYNSENAIETVKGLNGNYEFTASGDVLIESTSVDAVVQMHNAQASAGGNYRVRSNLWAANSTDCYIKDTVDGRAPTLSVLGYLYFSQAHVTTTNGKSKEPDGSLSNTDGYIYTAKKFISSPHNGGEIGDSINPIDVYCHGAYFASVPKFAEDYDVIKKAFDNADPTGNSHPGDNIVNGGNGTCTTINGNMYSYSADARTGGDVCFYTGQTTTINGDLYVDGDIYFVSNSSLTVNGTLYCTGSIIFLNDENSKTGTNIAKSYSCKDIESRSKVEVTGGSGKITAGAVKTSKPSGKRAELPDVSFEPQTTQYNNASPNDMFISNSIDANNLQSKYNIAYNKTNDSNWMEHVYIDPECNTTLKSVYDDANKSGGFANVRDNYKTLYINESLNFTPIKSHLQSTYSGIPINNFKFIVKMKGTEDLYILLPNDMSQIDITVDYSGSTWTGVNEKDSNGNVISPSVPKNFCYFMLDSGSDGKYYKTKSPEKSTWNFYGTWIWDARNDRKNFVGTKNRVNNTFILVPNNCDISIKNDGDTIINAVIYGPECNMEITGTGTPNRAAVYGQNIVGTLQYGNTGTTVTSSLPAPGSILKYIESLKPSDGAIKFQYYIKHKS